MTYVNDTQNSLYPSELTVFHCIGPDFRDSQNLEEFKEHFKILVDVYRQIFKTVIGSKHHSSPLYLTAISTGRFLGMRIHVFHYWGGHMTVGAIGEALKALSEDAEISASDIEILRLNLTLVVFPEQGGDRFSRLSPFMEQSSNLAVEADLEEIGLRNDQVMNLEVNEWKVEPTVVEKTDDGNMHEVVNDDKYDEICKSLESDFRSRDEVARQKALLDEKQSSMDVMLPLMHVRYTRSYLVHYDAVIANARDCQTHFIGFHPCFLQWST